VANDEHRLQLPESGSGARRQGARKLRHYPGETLANATARAAAAMVEEMGISVSSVQRIWRAHEL
jgi:hypothetical protein